MKILYWNCTSPGLETRDIFKTAKIDFIGAVVRAHKPDLVCLDEMSCNIASQLELNDYGRYVLSDQFAEYVYWGAIENPGAHLNQCLWIKVGVKCKPCQFGVPHGEWLSEQTKRDLLYVAWREGEYDVRIWFLHANASYNGRVAAILACKRVKESRDLFIGDFNCGIDEFDYGVRPDVGECGFTQWNKEEGRGERIPNSVYWYTPNPHGIIDFAIGNEKLLTIEAINTVNTENKDQVKTFLLNFDHFPIVYNVSPK